MSDRPSTRIDLVEEEFGRTASNLLRGYLRLYVLELLQERPHAGSEIASHLVHTCSWKPSPGSIYPLLKHLEEQGLAESRWEIGDRPRRVYALTEQGSAERMQLRTKLEPQLRRTLRMLEAHIEYLFGRDTQ